MDRAAAAAGKIRKAEEVAQEAVIYKKGSGFRGSGFRGSKTDKSA